MNSEYVCFLDSDDFLDITYCQKLYENIVDTSSDISCCGHRRINILNHKLKPWLPIQTDSSKPNDDVYNFTKHRNVTQKLFKTKIIKDNHIYFSTNLNYMEDALFLVKYLSYCNKITSVKEALYYVQMHPNSLCRNVNLTERRKKDSELAKKEMNKILSNTAL